jgi:3-oxoacyl-[acyl-carrier-protein] synthase-3
MPNDRYARIVAADFYVPANVIPNQYFNDLLGEDVDTWLQTNLTIRERRWTGADESTADLAEKAARKVLSKANWQATDLDLIIVSTDTPEYVSPSTASVVQYRLAAANAGTFDVNSACSGFVSILETGARYIISDKRYQRVLLIGAYAMSKFLNREDKKTVTLFADGAGAVLLEASEEQSGFIDAQLETQGQYHDWMGIYAGGTAHPINGESLAAGQHLLQFVRKFPKEINPGTWTKMIEEVLGRQNLSPDDIAMYFFTQININSIRETLANLKLDMSRTHTVMDRFAYTGSACIPMAFSEAWELNKVRRGDKIVFMGSGGGLAFATALFQL